jgi:hypothetical protein
MRKNNGDPVEQLRFMLYCFGDNKFNISNIYAGFSSTDETALKRLKSYAKTRTCVDCTDKLGIFDL